MSRAAAVVRADIENGTLDATLPASKGKSRGRETLTALFALAASRDLSHVEFRMWVLIRRRDYKGHGTFVGDDRLMEELDASLSTVRKTRASLLRRGYLTSKRRGRHPHVYRAVLPTPDARDDEDGLPWD